ncbi:MAG: hypothetical protein ACLPV2_18510 [Steroidobacteraceae bacterium]
MIVAKVFPDPASAGRGKKKVESLNNFDKGELSKGRLILRVLPDSPSNRVSHE